MSDPYLDDLEFANKANIEAARKFKAERDTLEKEREDLMRITFEAVIEQCAKIAESFYIAPGAKIADAIRSLSRPACTPTGNKEVGQS